MPKICVQEQSTTVTTPKFRFEGNSKQYEFNAQRLLLCLKEGPSVQPNLS